MDAALVLGATACTLGALSAGARSVLALVVAMAAGALSLGVRLDAAERWRPARPVELTVEATVRDTSRAATWMRVDLDDVVIAEPGAPPPRRVQLLDRRTPSGVSALESALPGERVRARLRLRAPHALRNPGVRSGLRDLERRGVGAQGRLVHPALHVRLPEREGLRPLEPLYRWRAETAARLSQAGPGGALLRALALGDRSELSRESREGFARLGIAHLLAVSGVHLALVASLVFAAARALLARSAALAARWDTRTLALGAGVSAAVLYALVAGWGVPVRRALVLLLGVALAIARGLPRLRAQPLAVASIAILALAPDALFRAGTQLSFAASAALLAASRPLESAVRASRVRRALVDGLRTSASAVAATAPLLAFHFGRVAPLALFANLGAIPWTGAILLPAALLGSLAVRLLPAVPGEAVLAAAERVARLTLRAIEEAGARMPAAAASARPGMPWLLGAGALAVLAVRLRRTAARVSLALAVCAVVAWAPPAGMAPPPPRLVAFEVGQGDAALVQGRRAAVLVDAGGAIPGGVDLGERAVVPALHALGVRRLDVMVLTHADLDHRGGAPAVLEALPVGVLWIPFGARGDPGFAAALATARARNVPVLERGRGSPRARVGDLTLTALWPPPRSDLRSRNEGSLVLRVEVAGRRLLLPGDVGVASEAALVGGGSDLRADVLLLPHHGSRSSSSPSFLEAVGAAVAVASAPCGGRFSMPHRSVLRRARAAGLALWWTGRDGAVLVGLGDPLAVWAYGDGRARPRGSCLADPAPLKSTSRAARSPKPWRAAPRARPDAPSHLHGSMSPTPRPEKRIGAAPLSGGALRALRSPSAR